MHVWRTVCEKKMLKEDLLEQVLDPENMRAAYAAVKRNGGKAGIDGIETELTPIDLMVAM